MPIFHLRYTTVSKCMKMICNSIRSDIFNCLIINMSAMTLAASQYAYYTIHYKYGLGESPYF